MSPGVSASPDKGTPAAEPPYSVERRWRPLLYGLLLVLSGMGLYLATVVLAGFSRLIAGNRFGPFLQTTLWYSGLPVFAGLSLCALDFLWVLPRIRRAPAVPLSHPADTRLTVVLTAYNDEPSISPAVRDFKAHPNVERVVVVDNNSRDGTAEAARLAGAEVVVEEKPGYGRCVYRALTEGMRFDDAEFTLLCEGDMTFRAYDIDKFLAYIGHADIVNGTRIVEQLRDQQTQLKTFMYYGNFFVGKLLEAKHAGRGTFTDVGTTYKLCRNSVLRRLLPALDSSVNLEFNAHFLDTALSCGVRIVECPITFHPRVGRSKGGNTNNFRALKVGLSMIAGILTSCRRRIALDSWPGMPQFLSPGVEGIVSAATNLSAVEEESVDFAFASNLFEHLTQNELAATLEQLRHKLKKSGTLNILQPNYRFAYREYFDDYTHVAVYSDRSLADFLGAHGFRVSECYPRFLPLTIKSRFPVFPFLIRTYLRLPFKPMGGQMLIRACPA